MNEIKNAQRIVEESRLQIDRAFSELEGRFDLTRSKVKDSVNVIRDLPDEISTQFSHQGDGKSLVSTFGVFVIAGYLLGSWIAEGRTRRGVGTGSIEEPNVLHTAGGEMPDVPDVAKVG